MDDKITSDISVHIELALTSHGIPRGNIKEADPKPHSTDEGPQLVITYSVADSSEERQLAIPFGTPTAAMNAYEYIKTNKRYPLVKERPVAAASKNTELVEEPKFNPLFIASL
jgi:hypothetical protein